MLTDMIRPLRAVLCAAGCLVALLPAVGRADSVSDCDCGEWWWSDTCSWQLIQTQEGQKWTQKGGQRAEPKCHEGEDPLPVEEGIYLEIYIETMMAIEAGVSFYVDVHGSYGVTTGANQGYSFNNTCNTVGCCTPDAWCYTRHDYSQKYYRRNVTRTVPGYWTYWYDAGFCMFGCPYEWVPEHTASFTCSPCSSWVNNYVTRNNGVPICSNTQYVTPAGSDAVNFIPPLLTNSDACSGQ